MNVLIVDDNLPLAENLGELLEEEGHHVRLAGEAEGAMALVGDANAGVDLALIDICLGNDDGVVLAQRLRERRPQLRVALMTAFTSVGRVSHAEALDLGPIFPKPLPLEALVQLLAT